MRRALVTLAASLAVTLATALPVRALGLTSVTVSCSNGDSFSATVDADGLDGLTQSIQAMTLYPAGLSCALTQAPALTSLGGVASAWTASGFVVGGGRFQLPCPSGYPAGSTYWLNFGLSAHNEDGSRSVKGGTFNLAVPDGPTQCVGPSNYTSKPYCLIIVDDPPGPPQSPWFAYLSATVTEAHGDFLSYLQGQNIGVGLKDTGNPGHQTIGPDRIIPRQYASSCDYGSSGWPNPDTEGTDVLNGNITIHPTSQF